MRSSSARLEASVAPTVRLRDSGGPSQRIPSVKLVAKERVGARVRRRYDVPRTPLERVLACPEITPQVAAELQRQRDRLDPFALAATIDTKLERLYALANPRHRPPASADRPAAEGPAARPTSSVTSQAAR